MSSFIHARMHVDVLQRHLVVCAQSELGGHLEREPAHWSVVSIREPEHAQPDLSHARRSCEVLFLDQESRIAGAFGSPPSQAHLEKIFRFADAVPTAPLLIHCWAGRSRSTAVALALIVRALWNTYSAGPALIREAADTLLTIRPIARPNSLVLKFGLELFLPAKLAATLTKELINEPRLLQNRLTIPNR